MQVITGLMEGLVPHVGTQVRHISVKVLPILHPSGDTPGSKVVPKDVRCAVFKSVWVSCLFPALVEKGLDACGIVFLFVSVRKKYICFRIYPARDPIIFPAHDHNLVGDRNASVLMPFGIRNVNGVM